MKKSTKSIVVAGNHPWNIKRARQLRESFCRVAVVTCPEKLTLSFLRCHQPDYVFFVHWSWKIPVEIYTSFNCVLFHMTDLPYGRGGSPLQNLIVRGHQKTKISAIKVVEEIDAGPVYLKVALNLSGTAAEIYERAAGLIFDQMIPEMLHRDIVPLPQKGKVVSFFRRKGEDGNLAKLNRIKDVFDYIRMLDAPGYPPAFLSFNNVSVSFSDARMMNGKLVAKAEFVCPQS